MKKAFTPLEAGQRRWPTAACGSLPLTGFTLVEIMVVLLILSVLIAIAVPSILRSRVAANEGAAIATLKTLSTACQAYHIDQQVYPSGLQVLSTANPPYIDNALGSGKRQGYEFVYESADSDHFTVHANPTHTGLLKGRFFYLDESGGIRAHSDAPAGPDDEVIG